MPSWTEPGRRLATRARSGLRNVGPVSPSGSSAVDMSCTVGGVDLASPVMCASGTAGHGAELSAYFDLSTVGAIVVKSLAAYPWEGNAAPRVTHTPSGMINAVGLQGPGVAAWVDHELDELLAAGANVVVSIWGRSVAEYAKAAELLAPVSHHLAAVEVNISCPNLEDRNTMFAHSVEATRAVMTETALPGVKRWAKLSPNVADIVPIASAAAESGAAAVTIANTMIGLVIDTETRRPLLSNGRGGLSGPAIRPIAVRAVWDVATDLPSLPIIGVGGVARGNDAVEFLMAGASAVQVGTATFADPRAAVHIHQELADWCEAHGVSSVTQLVRAAH